MLPLTSSEPRQYKELRDYLYSWDTLEKKPCNEPVFINDFIFLVNTLEDARDINFDDQNHFLSKQVALHMQAGSIPYNQFTLQLYSGLGGFKADVLINFEIAYSANQILVYSQNHCGFCVSEYIKMSSDHPLFNDVLASITALLKRIGV